MAAASTREELGAEVAAAVAAKEVVLSPSARLGMTQLSPHRNLVAAYSSFSPLNLAKQAACVFVFLSQERKMVVCCTAEKPQAESLLMGGDRELKSNTG